MDFAGAGIIMSIIAFIWFYCGAYMDEDHKTNARGAGVVSLCFAIYDFIRAFL